MKNWIGSSAGMPETEREQLRLRALAEKERRRRTASRDFSRFQTDPVAYFREVLGIEPWAGQNGHKGQLELIQDIGESVRLQLAGEPAPKVFWAEAGHGCGKTYGGAGLVNWFFDAFSPSITMTTAPTKDQVELLLWKNVKAQREGRDLPGRVLPDAPKMTKGANHFAIGRTTSDAGGQGSARFQGQHDDYLFFVLDEAEGLPEFVFGAVDAMMTGGKVVICLMIANPQTRTSAFHKKGKEPGVSRYRLSLLDFPNVVQGQEVVKGGTKREWVNARIAKHCQVVSAHNEDEHTFSVAWDVPWGEEGEVMPAGTVFLPDAEFMFRVMGIAPKNLSANTVITPGRYEAAKTRIPIAALAENVERVRYGVDVARDGDDVGAIYRAWKGELVRVARLAKLHGPDYLGALRTDMAIVADAGATSCHVRVDGGGGFGGGVVDLLHMDDTIAGLFQDFAVFEVHNNASPHDPTAYGDLVTEMYAEAAEALKGYRLVNPPAELEADLTERLYKWAHLSGVSVKKLEPKEAFKKRVKRSPDDGDGAALALSPDHLFKPAGDFFFLT